MAEAPREIELVAKSESFADAANREIRFEKHFLGGKKDTVIDVLPHGDPKLILEMLAHTRP